MNFDLKAEFKFVVLNDFRIYTYTKFHNKCVINKLGKNKFYKR